MTGINISKAPNHVNLQKGTQFMLPGSLRVLDLMLGWEPTVVEPQQQVKNSSFLGLGRLVNAANTAVNSVTKSVDVDSNCFEVSAQGKVLNVVSFKNLSDRANNIYHSGDNLTGKGQFPDETIHLKDLNSISPGIMELHFWINIFSGESDFGHIRECIAAVVDVEKREELARLNLTAQYAGKSSILIGAISRTPQGWMFTAIGEAFNEKRIEAIVQNHY